MNQHESLREEAERAADPRVDLAVKRTEVAWDRTLLAWLRTTSALVAAGVAFDKGAQFLHEARLAAGTALVRSGHLVDLSLTAAATVLLTFMSWQYLKDMRELAAIKGSRPTRVPPALIACALLIVLGTAAVFVLMIDTHWAASVAFVSKRSFLVPGTSGFSLQSSGNAEKRTEGICISFGGSS